ncbi:MAG: site-2 protease family protein [Lentisphaeria bacterium]|nr:site-2 protease family protein [Lentisphaeria bacterium]
MFVKMLFESPLQFLTICAILIFSICLHEFCHAWIAYREGDDGAAEFMTLNPLRQMGPVSLLMLALIGIAWGVVPVDRSKLRSRWSHLKISLAGPAANLALFLLSVLIFLLIGWASAALQLKISKSAAYPVFYLIFLFGMYNFALLTFNLIPAPGLDGWHVLTEFFPKIRRIRSETFKGALLILMMLAFFSASYLFMAGGWLMQQVLVLGIRLGGGEV